MKASELRIGNYINLMLNDEDYNTIQVRIEDLVYIDKKQGVYEPIPLIEEWLLKFDGFIKDGEYLSIGRLDCKYSFKYRDWADNWAFYIEYTDGRPTDDGVKYPVAFDIKYVHQLQNLYFAVTGEELTLKTNDK